MRVLVIGGRGYYGSRVVDVLRSLAGMKVVVGGRGQDVGVWVDLREAETFDAMGDFEAVVDCADSVGAPPDGAARWALENGVAFFEAGADSATTERLLALDASGAKGHLVVGVGVFPGVSTILARAAAGLVGDCQTLDLGYRLSPFSGAGRGNVALMVRSLETPSLTYADGVRREGPAVGPALPLPYLGSGPQPSSQVGLPDVPLVHRATGVRSVRAAMALVPGILRFNFRLLVWLLGKLGPLRRPLLGLTGLSMRLVRAALLRGVSSPVQLTAVANAGRTDERALLLSFRNGQLGMARGVAAAVELWRHKEPRPAPGIYTAADLFGLDETLALLRRFDPGASDPQLETLPG